MPHRCAPEPARLLLCRASGRRACILLSSTTIGICCALLALSARARHYGPRPRAFAEALSAIAAEHLRRRAGRSRRSAANPGLDGDPRDQGRARRTPKIIVISATASLASAIASYELDAFAFVPKPFDLDQLFATVDRALEPSRRRARQPAPGLGAAAGQRSRRGAAQPGRAGSSWSIACCAAGRPGWASIARRARLHNPETGAYDFARDSGIRRGPRGLERRAAPPVPRPSDRVLATQDADACRRRACSCCRAEAPRACRCARRSASRCWPATTCSACSAWAARSRTASPTPTSSCSGIIANQVAVGVQNAQLHAFIRPASRSGKRPSTRSAMPIAVFDRHGRLLPRQRGAARGLWIVRSRRCAGCPATKSVCAAAPFPDCAVGRAAGQTPASQDEVTRPDGDIFSVTTCPVPMPTDGAAVVQIAKNVTQRNPERAPHAPDERRDRRAANARLVATVERLKTTQAQLLQAEKLSAIGQLVAGVAHELNNPLTSVIGYAQLLQEELRDTRTGDRAGADRAAGARPAADRRGIRARRARSSATCWPSRAASRPSGRRRTSPSMVEPRPGAARLRVPAQRDGSSRPSSSRGAAAGAWATAASCSRRFSICCSTPNRRCARRPLRRIRVGARLMPRRRRGGAAHQRHRPRASRTRTCGGSSIPSSPRGKSAKAPASASASATASSAITAARFSVESRVGQGTTFSLMLPARCGRARRPDALVAHRDADRTRLSGRAAHRLGAPQSSPGETLPTCAAGWPPAFERRCRSGAASRPTPPAWSEVLAAGGSRRLAGVDRGRSASRKRRARRTGGESRRLIAVLNVGDPRRAARPGQGVRMNGQQPLLVVVDDEQGILDVVSRFASGPATRR